MNSPSGTDELIVHSEYFHVVATGFGHHGWTQPNVGCADDKALCPLGREDINGREEFLPVWNADFDQLKPVLVGALLGEFPFVLEPQFLRHFHQKSQPDLFLDRRRGSRFREIQQSAAHTRCSQPAPRSSR